MYKRLGFLIDEHQVNVAITRAKLGMFIVGNVAHKKKLMTKVTATT